MGTGRRRCTTIKLWQAPTFTITTFGALVSRPGAGRRDDVFGIVIGMGGPAATPSSPLARKRLHITPFNPTLLDRFVPSSLQPQTTGISYHTVETFPERGFGYVELPAMEAEKLKKKFNGSTLKGTKVRIEDAKPEKKRKVEMEEGEDDKKAKKRVKKEKRKREEGVLPGHELEEGRHVKRGWTEEGADKKRKKKADKAAEGTEGKKLRFKTTVPPNAVPIDKKSKVKAKEKEAKESKSKRKTVVQEFAKSQTPNAANAVSRNAKAAEFEEGKGWLDAGGNVVEAAPVLNRPKRKQNGSKSAPMTAAAPSVSQEDDPESEDDDEESSVVSSDSDDEPTPPTNAETPASEAVDTPMLDPAAEASNPVNDTPKQVHPLEALFKRPAPKSDTGSATKPRPSPIDTSFSFFNSGTADEDDHADEETGATAYPPQTPHTKQDMEWRSIRSAAPTPDTAAIGRKFSFPFAQGADDEDDDGDEEIANDAVEKVAASSGAQNVEREESEFRKWFYDTRGEHNRDWKKRRREGRKAMRQRENRRLSRRVV